VSQQQAHKWVYLFEEGDGGEPRSIAFCHLTGLDCVSCSPFRVPVARLASAQAALEMDGAIAADK
jgi:pyruvate,orthophosphate dikinase